MSIISTNKKIWAIIPARSGSKGLPNKNIKHLSGIPLLNHTINFAKKLELDRIFLSTDSAHYRDIGVNAGAYCPFLRSQFAANDTAMEEHILEDIDKNLRLHGIEPPDIIIWLRPTFPFRRIETARRALSLLNDNVDSVRIVLDAERRLYELTEGLLKPTFNTNSRSMIRRQELKPSYRVFHTDIFWWKNISWGAAFLGEISKGVVGEYFEGVDIDNEHDFALAELMLRVNFDPINDLRHDS